MIDPTSGLPAQPYGEKPAFCALAGRSDKIRSTFCVDRPPAIHGMADLVKATGLDLSDTKTTGFAMAAHSTSLTARSTSPINPRVFVFKLVQPNSMTDAVILSYVRGEPLVEIAAKENSIANGRYPWNFYLARIGKACAQRGCTNADLLTDRFETDWEGVALFQDTELVDTTVDCTHCHASPGGTFTIAGQALLLFVEKSSPWTHWFAPDTASGQTYYAQLKKVIGDNGYGIIPKERIGTSSPGDLWNASYFSFNEQDQDREYEPRIVQQELSLFQKSSTWQAMFDDYASGKSHAPPNYSAEITDPDLVAKATDLLQRYARGEVADAAFPDFRNVFAAKKLVEIGHLVEPSADVKQTVAMACGQCHNGTASKGLVRSGFNAKDPMSWTAEVKKRVVERVSIDSMSSRMMPPPRYSTLSAAAKEQVLNAFR